MSAHWRSPIKSRTFSSGAYRYGFNGKEKDDEINGSGNAYDFGARIYDGRLGRWLSVDPLMKKYPSLSVYVGMGNNPILYLDLDGEDYVYFNTKGVETKRVVNSNVNKTYVLQHTYTRLKDRKKGYRYVEAPMPTQINNTSKFESAMKRDYNRYDYQITAETFLFNQKLVDGDLPEKVKGTGIPITGTVPKLDVNLVKAVMFKETTVGYNKNNNGSKDVMQTNVPGDWANSKKRIGLKKGTIPTPQQSIRSGIQWLYLKGTTVSDIKYDKGKIVGGTAVWTGGSNWKTAVKKYNGGGDSKYMSIFNSILKALKKGYSKDGLKEKEANDKKE